MIQISYKFVTYDTKCNNWALVQQLGQTPTLEILATKLGVRAMFN